MPHKGKKKYKNKNLSVLVATKNRRKRLKLRPKLKAKLKSKSKSGKLILKNLPFKATEADLKKYLHNFGTLTDVKILKKSDGDPMGRGVIEFDDKQSAMKAVENCNGKVFMGRKIVVDWAVLPGSESSKIENDETVEDGSGDSDEISEEDSAKEIKKKKIIKKSGVSKKVISKKSKKSKMIKKGLLNKDSVKISKKPQKA